QEDLGLMESLGSTAYIKQAIKDGNLLESDTIQLEDGTTAYIHQVTVQQKGILTSNLGQIQKGISNIHKPMQLDDGSAAYIHHPLGLQVGSTILTLQPGGALAELAADDTVDVDTITTLENYAKVALFQSVLSLSHFTCPCFVCIRSLFFSYFYCKLCFSSPVSFFLALALIIRGCTCCGDINSVGL
uniref:Uncharacterized protein n=1 Tax=Salmo trutta TaxID=8032 RepID=A0A674DMA0_SALTR